MSLRPAEPPPRAGFQTLFFLLFFHSWIFGVLDFWIFRLDAWTTGLDFCAFLASQDSLLELFWGPTRPSWTPKCTDLMDWTSSLDFWTFILRFALLNWTFWVFLLLAEHAGALVYAMKSALPDFGMDTSLVLSWHQIVKDFLYIFEPIFGHKSVNIIQK